MHRDRRVPLAGRVPRLSATFRRSLGVLGVAPGSPTFRAVFAAIGALSQSGELPSPIDGETAFSPGKAYVRRVTGHNVWVLYRFDESHVFIMAARGEPPVPIDE